VQYRRNDHDQPEGDVCPVRCLCDTDADDRPVADANADTDAVCKSDGTAFTDLLSWRRRYPRAMVERTNRTGGTVSRRRRIGRRG
jgi:hypothetical protein